MPTKNSRIKIKLEESTACLLGQIAQHEHKSVSSLAKELVLEALEYREDLVLSAIAESRDMAKAKKMDHDDTWK